MMTIKAGLLIVAMIAILRALDAPPVTDLVFIFIAGGVIPGTGIVVPPEVILFTTAMALMMVFGLLFHLYAKHQAMMRTLVPRYKVKRQDPEYTALVPGLGKALTVSKALRTYVRNAPKQIYFWLKYLGHPARIQAILLRVHDAGRVVLATMGQWLAAWLTFLQNMPHNRAILRRWGARARAYILRVTTF